MLDNEVHQVADVVGWRVPVGTHPALLGAAVGCGKVQLVVVGTQVEHQVEHGLLCGLGVAVGLVDLVDDHYRLQSQFDSFLQNKACLWHWSLKGVDNKQHTVGHIEHALHLAAEVAMPRRIDDVDLVVLVADADVFGKDGDAAFALKVIVVEDEVAGLLVVAEKFGLVQHSVDKGGLTVVDVCYNCHITNILH